jgi:hypothetical protein
VQIGELAKRQQGSRERQRVGGDHPLHVGTAEAEVPLHRRQRGGHQRQVGDHEELRCAQQAYGGRTKIRVYHLTQLSR